MNSGETGRKQIDKKRKRRTEADKDHSRAGTVVFAVLCLIPILATVLYGAVDSGTWVLISILAGVIALAWLADGWKGEGLWINRSLLLVPVAGLIFIGLIQLVPVFSSGISTEILPTQFAQPISLDPYSTRFFVIRLFVYFLFLAAALTYLSSDKRLKRLTIIVICLCAVTAFFGILQFLAKPEAIYGLRETPNAVPFGPFVNQHHFAAFSELGFGLAVGLIAGRGVKRDKMLLLAVAALMMIVGALLTGSRGGLLSYVGIAAFILLAVSRLEARNGRPDGKRSNFQLAAMAGAAIAAFVMIVGVVIFVGGDNSLARYAGTGGVPADISNGRIHFWTTALRIFADHPILGAGYDAFGVAFTKYDAWNGVFRVEQAHNDYLQTLADAGVAGFVCVVGFIFLLYKKGIDVIAAAKDPFRSSAAIGALAGCTGILIHSFFDFPLRTPVNAFLFLLLAAIATVTISTGHGRNSTQH